MTNEEIKTAVEVDDSRLVSYMLRDLIEGHRMGRGAVTRALSERYRQSGLPIQTRRSPNPNKVDERVPNDFYADIVDTKTGYMGNEVIVELGREADEYERTMEAIHDFQRRNYGVDENSEMIKTAARDGRGYRLLYVPAGRNEIRMRIVPEYEGILVGDESIDEVIYFIRYWHIDDHQYDTITNKAKKTQRTVVEWYDAREITYYISNEHGEYALDVSKGNAGKQPHLFDRVPVVDFRNNQECQAEPEKAIALIDAYDTVLSATVSEIEQMRLAYLAYRGGEKVDNELLRLLQQTGVFPLGPDGDAKFITKDIAIDAVKSILDELRKNIYQFSRSLDLSKDFGGELRVIGWQVALLNLENSCKVTERKFKRAMYKQYEILGQKWREWNVANLDTKDLQFTFTRNFPKDLASEAKILMDLLGSVSRKTAYSQMSFIEDTDTEIEEWEAEREVNMSLFGIDAGPRDEDGESTELADERE